jgi:hypothetical protein
MTQFAAGFVVALDQIRSAAEQPRQQDPEEELQ